MRRPLVRLTFLSLAIVLLAVWFATRSNDALHDASASADASRVPTERSAAPAVEPLEIAAPEPSAPPPSRAEVEEAAQHESKPESPAPGETLAELRGRFVLPDGRPASGVALRVHGWEANSERVMKHGRPLDWTHPETTTDAEGRFTFRFDPPLAFQFTLDATLAGYANVSWRWSSLPPREVTDVGEVTLLRSGLVRGRVVDARGVAAPGGWIVYGEALGTKGGEGRDTTQVRASTDPVTAEFALEGLPPGPAMLKLYSRIANWIDGPRVEVRAAEEVTADIVYDGPDNSRRIVVITFNRRCHVFSNPASGSIVLHGAGEERTAKRIAGSSQSWSFENLEPGAYDIEIRDPLFEPWRQNGVRTGTSVDAHLVGNAAVKLAVRDAEGNAIDNYRLRLRYPGASFMPNEFEVRAAGEPAPVDGVYRGLMPTARTDSKRPASDSSNLDAANLDLEKLDLAELETAFEKRARQGSGIFELLVVAPGFGAGSAEIAALAPGETREVTVVLQPQTQVRGRVAGVDPMEVDGVSVVLADASLGVEGALEYVEGVWSTGAPDGLRVETHTDSAGGFSFDELSAGPYVVVARFNHDFHAVHGPFDVGVGESAEIELTAMDHGAIEGRILAHAGELENAWVEALGAGFYDPFAGGWSTFDGEAPPRARVDAQGRFRVAPLRPATYELSLHHSPTPLERDRRHWRSRFSGGLPLGAVTIAGPHVANVEFDHTQRRRGAIHCTAIVDGNPAIGWRVEARFESADSVANSRATSAITGPDGVAHLELLEPGAWKVGLVETERKWSSWIATPRELAPGGELTLKFDVALHSARVLVLDARTGRPRAKQWVHWGNGGGSAKLTTDANGELELALPLGSYTASRNRDKATVEWTSSGPVPAEIKL